MKKIMILAVFLVGFMGNINAAEVGDKIKLDKSVLFTVMCESYTKQAAKYYYLGGAALSKGSNDYLNKISNDNCQVTTSSVLNENNIVAIVVDKKQQIITDKDLSLLKKGTVQKFEILKVSILSVGKMKAKVGEIERWFVFPESLETYKIIK